MSVCCPPESLGYLAADQTSIGEKILLEETGFEFYISHAGCAGTKKGLIFTADIFGWNSGRIRLIADHFASQGYLTVIPKLLTPPLEDGNDGDAIPRDFNNQLRAAELKFYLQTKTWEDTFKGRIQTAIDLLHSRGVQRIGMVGFCYGGWVMSNVMSDEDTCKHITCGASPHPSLHIESRIFERDPLALVSRIKGPILFLPAGNDPDDYRPGGSFYELMRENYPATEVSLEFGNMIHGWSVRGDTSDPEIKEKVALCFELILSYFQKHL